MRLVTTTLLLLTCGAAWAGPVLDQLRSAAGEVPRGDAEATRSAAGARFGQQADEAAAESPPVEKKPDPAPVKAVQNAGEDGKKQQAVADPNKPVIIIQNQNVNNNGAGPSEPGKAHWNLLKAALIGGTTGLVIGLAGGHIGAGIGFLAGALAGVAVALWNNQR